MADFELVTVFESQGMLGAQVAKSKLESVGLPVFLKYEPFGQVLGLTVDGLGRVEVQVPADLAEDAAAVLAEVDGDENDGRDFQPGNEGDRPNRQA